MAVFIDYSCFDLGLTCLLIERAIAKIKAKHPQAFGELEAIAVGAVLALDRVIV